MNEMEKMVWAAAFSAAYVRAREQLASWYEAAEFVRSADEAVVVFRTNRHNSSEVTIRGDDAAGRVR